MDLVGDITGPFSLQRIDSQCDVGHSSYESAPCNAFSIAR